MDLNRILREGFIAGCIGAAVVAVWFLIVDSINGQPFFTPAMLGGALFPGAHDPNAIVIEPGRTFGYTMIHGTPFVLLGRIPPALAAHSEFAPSTWLRVLDRFCRSGWGFYILVGPLPNPVIR